MTGIDVLSSGAGAVPDRRAGAILDLSPLCHPGWWAGLSLLMVNDSLLKGAGILPGWLTGKLSDFAFLVVAPVLFASLLPLRVPGRRVSAFLLTAGLFVTANLSPRFSDGIVSVAASLGLRWRLWPDPTDLVALVVLPGSWWLAIRRDTCVLRRGRRLLQAAGVVTGALACLATSPPPSYPHSPFLVNQTANQQAVTFTWLLRKVSCGADLPSLAASLTAADLADPHTETLASGQVAALDTRPAPETVLVGSCRAQTSTAHTGDGSCTTAVVAVAGGPAVLFSAPRSWNESDEGPMLSCGGSSPPESLCMPVMSTTELAGEDALSLRLQNGQLAFRAGSRLKMVEIDLQAVLARPDDGQGCRTQLDDLRELIEASATCTDDSDCRVLQGLATPFAPACHLYVNRSLPYSTVKQRKAVWDSRCVAADDDVACPTGPAQPPVCRSGTCGEACPGVSLPACTYVCSAFRLTTEGACAPNKDVVCYTPRGESCLCSGTPLTWSCQAPAPHSPTCPLACMSYLPIGDTDPNLVPADGGTAHTPADGGSVEAGQASDAATALVD